MLLHTAKRWEELERYCRITNRRKIHPGYWRYVAAVVILFIIGGIGFLYFVPDTRKEMTLAAVGPKEFHQQAVLVLENGKELVLNGIKDTCLSLGQGERLWINDQGRLAYHQDSLQQETPEEWHILRIPRGGEYTLVLEDGSRVWLNSASELRYPVRFTGKNRQVTLEGEAYFEVAKDSLNRFVVQAGDLAVEALGTSFNVKAYEEDNQAVVTLFQGKVKTSVGRDEAFLLPDQAVTYLKNKGQLKKSTLNDAYRACLWRNNELAFNDEALSEIAVLLNRMYNIQVVFKSEKVKALRFTGVITNNSLDNIIELISLTSPIIYTSKGDTIIIDEKK